jgi:hypothetical protein
LSQRESDFYEKIVECARKNKWSGKARKKVNVDENLWRIFGSLAGHYFDDKIERAALKSSLEVLRNNGKIAFIGRDDRNKISLPVAFWLEPIASKEKVIPACPSFHSELRWVEECWPPATPIQRKAFEAINAWLWSQRNLSALVEIPIRERSVEIFGSFDCAGLLPEEEKVFDKGWSPGFQLKDRALLLKLLRAKEVHPPLVPNSALSVGNGHIILAVENFTTAWSIRECLPDNHSLSAVAWSAGNEFSASIKSLAGMPGITEIRYFGDLDKTGLRIPCVAGKAVEEWGIPQPTPAFELYSALLARGKPSSIKCQRVTASVAVEAAGWLAEPHRERAIELMTRGQRLAQEWVGYEYLRSHPHWHSDVC